jgi:secreted PhoX family phosphatase
MPESQGQALTQVNNLAPFRAISPTTADDLVLPADYRYNPVRIYGDEIAPGVPFGYNADFIGYFPIDWPEGGQSSVDGLLTVNHEYNNPLLQYGYSGGAKLQEHINLGHATNGISVFRVQKQPNGTWAFIQDSHNRIVSGLTPCRLTGPLAGTPGVKGATEVTGSVGNCSGRQTPWGTRDERSDRPIAHRDRAA